MTPIDHFFPIHPKRCCHCGKDYLIAVNPAEPSLPGANKEASGVCWRCMRLPFMAEMKKAADEFLREVRPKRWLSLLRAEIAAG